MCAGCWASTSRTCWADRRGSCRTWRPSREAGPPRDGWILGGVTAMPARIAKFSRTLTLLAAGLALTTGGCLPKTISSWFHKDKPNYHANALPDQDMSPSKTNGELTRAHDLFNSKDYSSAARLFSRIADNSENSAAVAEEALFFQAECERLRDKLPAAEAVYKKVLHDFPSGAYKQQA